jgi:hypothetical protein
MKREKQIIKKKKLKKLNKETNKKSFKDINREGQCTNQQ